MKKKILSLCLVVALFFPVVFLFTACDKNKTTNNIEIDRIYQDCYGNVYAEISNLDKYLNQGTYSVQVSMNSQDWYTVDYNQTYFDKTDKYVFSFLQPSKADLTSSAINSYYMPGESFSVNSGEQISVQARVILDGETESNILTSVKQYTLKTSKGEEVWQYMATSVAEGIGSVSESYNFDIFVFYKDSTNPYTLNIGKYMLNDEETATIVRELTAPEQIEVDSFDLEYKIVNPKEAYFERYENNSYSYERVKFESIEEDENLATYLQEGWSDDLDLENAQKWTYIDMDGYKNEELYFLIRQKATDNRTHSSAFCISYTISREYVGFGE